APNSAPRARLTAYRNHGYGETVVAQLVARLDSRLPRAVYVLQAGLVLNAFGNGAAAPFMVIYLHDTRGFGLGVAGAVSATGAGCGLVSGLVAGTIGDRRGARPTMVAGLWLSAIAYVVYPFVREPWQAFGAAVLAG